MRGRGRYRENNVQVARKACWPAESPAPPSRATHTTHPSCLTPHRTAAALQVQLVLYRMMLVGLLEQWARRPGAGGRVTVTGQRWAPRDIAVECVLRTGAAGHAPAHLAAAVPAGEVDGMAWELTHMLHRFDGRVAAALDVAATPDAARLPYQLGAHCGSCPHARECWADAGRRGALQLSGCSAAQAQALQRPGVGVQDIEDLARLADSNSRSSNGSDALAAAARASGLPRGEVAALALAASVRRLRAPPRLGAASFAGGREVVLLPGAPQSCLPARDAGPPRLPLVRVYLHVSVDAVMHRIVGVAAHVVSC